MPFLVRYPREITPATHDDHLVLNVDFAPTFLDYAGLPVAPQMQGRSFRALLRGAPPPDWREAMYYRYFMHLAHHNVYAHYGVRTSRYKLIYYYEHEPDPPEWELFDLAKDPHELNNVYDERDYQETVHQLKDQLRQLREELGDATDPWDVS